MLRNLTPHAINIVTSGGAPVMTLPPETPCPRVEMFNAGTVDGVPVVMTRPGLVLDLPEHLPGVHLIVSQIVASAAKRRDDLFFPDGLVRDAKGVIIGCTRLVQSKAWGRDRVDPARPLW